MNTYIKHISTEDNEIFLTFDDGPNPFYTPKVLDILKEEGVKATFFLIGRHVEVYPEIVQRILEEGHSIGGHSYSHGGEGGDLSWGDFVKGNASIEKITNTTVHILRVPQFGYSKIDTVDGNKVSRITELTQGELKEKIEHGDMYVIDCSINPHDWNVWVPSWYIKRHVLKHLHPGAIVCLHDGSEKTTELDKRPVRTVRVLKSLIREIKKKGYRCRAILADTMKQ